jgi:glycosyltransferase involved in cell wall biosynthesis
MDGVTGRLVPRANEKAFADALVELGNAPEKCAKMGEAGRDFITESFSMTEMAAQYAGLICGKSLATGNDR